MHLGVIGLFVLLSCQANFLYSSELLRVAVTYLTGSGHPSFNPHVSSGRSAQIGTVQTLGGV